MIDSSVKVVMSPSLWSTDVASAEPQRLAQPQPELVAMPEVRIACVEPLVHPHRDRKLEDLPCDQPRIAPQDLEDEDEPLRAHDLTGEVVADLAPASDPEHGRGQELPKDQQSCDDDAPDEEPVGPAPQSLRARFAREQRSTRPVLRANQIADRVGHR